VDKTNNNLFGKIGKYSAKNPYKIAILTIFLIGISTIGIAQVQMQMGMDLYVNEESETKQNWLEIQEDFNKGNVIFVKIETEETDLYEPENSQKIADIYESYYNELKHGDIEAVSLTTSFSHPIKAGPGGGEIPETKEEIVHSLNFSFNQQRSNMGIIANLHPEIQHTEEYQKVQQNLENENYPLSAKGEEMFVDGNTAMFMIQYGDVDVPEDVEGDFMGLIPPSEDEIIENKIREITSQHNLPEDAKVTYTGTPVFEEAAFGLMLPEMIKLFLIAFGVIFATVFLLMRGKLNARRNIALPLITSLTAVVIMVGGMGFLGFNFNAIMLGVLPIALGLSIDYSLQVHSRYLEERQKGKQPTKAIQETTQHVGKALAIAMTTTAIGLGALLISNVPPTRQFGATSIIAIAAAMILSITLLSVLLVKFDKQKTRTTKSNSKISVEDRVGKLFNKVNYRRNTVLALGFLAIIAGAFAAPQVNTTVDMLDYWPDIQEREDIRELETSIPAPNINYIIIESEDAYTLDNFRDIQRFQHELEENEHIVTVMSPVRGMEVANTQPPTQGSESDTLPTEEDFDDAVEHRANVDRPPQLGLHPDEHPNRVVVQAFVADIEGETEREVIDFMSDTAEEEMPDKETRVTGEMVLNRNVIENVTSGLAPMTVLSFLLGFGFLSLSLKSLKDAAVIIGGVAVSSVLLLTGSMYLLNIPWNPLTVTISAIILGVGIDYGVHINERFREEKLKGKDACSACKTAISQKSRPILASGVTTLLGFGVLATSDFPVLANFGKAIILAMGYVILTSFILLPSLLVVKERFSSS